MLSFATLHSIAQDPSAFYQQYWHQFVMGSSHPQAVNQRVRSIFLELAQYSNRVFPVYPAEQFTAGQATLQGIYLDISVAADPSEEVTRFFLAHEWGHMVHGDPIQGMKAIGQYQMMLGAKAAEENADAYAATFMRRKDHDIRPVLDFICSIPDGGPSDPHGSPVARAQRIARIYGSPDKNVTAQCAPPAPGDDSTRLEKAIKAMADASVVKFRTVKGANRDRIDLFESTVKMPDFLGGRDATCDFEVDDNGDAVRGCTYVLVPKHSSEIDDDYDLIVKIVDKIVPAWTAVDGGDSNRRSRRWIQHANVPDPSALIILKVTENSTDDSEFLTLEFEPLS